jgi:hypothetical protein
VDIEIQARIEWMVSDKGDIMACHEQELQEILEIGRHLGSTPRYLLYYYGQLAIANDAGLMHWPEGPKVIVTVIKAQECVCGLSPARKAHLLARLRSLEGIRERQSGQSNGARGRLTLLRN